MKLGDYVLNKKILREAEENFKKLTPEKLKEATLMAKGSAFLAGMIVELLESDELINTKISDEQISNLIIKMLSTGIAIGILNIASRSDKPDIFIKLFKHYFEEAVQQFTEAKNANN